MGSKRLACLLLVMVAVGLAVAPLAVLADQPVAPLTPSASVAAGGEPWWIRGQPAHGRIDALLASGDGTTVIATDGRRLLSRDGGLSVVPLRSAESTARNNPAACAADLGAPVALTACVAPRGLPGVVVAIAADGLVWRRDGHGAWSRALILLPAGGLGAPPRVTSIATFDRPGLSEAVYVGTDGDGVVQSSNGGADWIRDDPGLPGHVLALATDPVHRAVLAGTDDGLWVHHLQPLPAPPAYASPDLFGKRVETGVVTLVAAALGALTVAGLMALPAVVRQRRR